jgi:hypothetical protein
MAQKPWRISQAADGNTRDAACRSLQGRTTAFAYLVVECGKLGA